MTFYHSIKCSLNKLPAQERIGDDVGEAELTGSYLDPIISPLFHDPENNRQFRWLATIQCYFIYSLWTTHFVFFPNFRLNTGVENTEARRPDGNMFKLEQRQVKFSTGYIEVKPDKSRKNTKKTHEDTLRLVNFCKDTTDKQDIKAMIAIQAVGNHMIKTKLCTFLILFFS